MGIEIPKTERIDPIREYSKEVLELMYPKKGKGENIKVAMKRVLARHGITEFNQVGKWMGDIGSYIKTHGDLKRWEKEAVEVPLGKHLEPVKKNKEPYEDVFAQAKRLRRERELSEKPLFAEQINEEIDKEEKRRGF